MVGNHSSFCTESNHELDRLLAANSKPPFADIEPPAKEYGHVASHRAPVLK